MEFSIHIWQSPLSMWGLHSAWRSRCLFNGLPVSWLRVPRLAFGSYSHTRRLDIGNSVPRHRLLLNLVLALHSCGNHLRRVLATQYTIKTVLTNPLEIPVSSERSLFVNRRVLSTKSLISMTCCSSVDVFSRPGRFVFNTFSTFS